MDIYIPKYREIETSPVGHKIGYSGEYRAILTGEDSRLKYDSGWKPNMILNQGLGHMVDNGTWKFNDMSVGNSDAALDVTQIGLQAVASLGVAAGARDGTFVGTPVGPDYVKTTNQKHTFIPGNATGTIKEAVLTYNAGNALTGAGIRFILDTPIDKLAGDQLVIEHRLSSYPDTADKIGTIFIDSVEYNYIFRYAGIIGNEADEMHRYNILGGSTSANCYAKYNSTLGSIEGWPTGTYTAPWPYQASGLVTSYGGATDTRWRRTEIIASVDHFNGLIQTLQGKYTDGGWQLRLGRVLDDTPFLKENTHEFRFVLEYYPTRHVP